MAQFYGTDQQGLEYRKCLGVTVGSDQKSTENRVSKKATVARMDEVLGLKLMAWQPASQDDPAGGASAGHAEADRTRSEKTGFLADQIRNQIADLGYDVDDSVTTTTVRPKRR